MIAVLSLLVVVGLSLLVTRIASVALTHTGLSEQSARFQARSAFTGAGFTTEESERVVRHPVRRRIIQLLMLLGNAGVVTAASTLILSLVGTDGHGPDPWAMVLLLAGLAVLVTLYRSRWIDRRLSLAIDWALQRYTDVDVRDYSAVLRLRGDYQLVDLHIEDDSWMAGRRLGELRLRDEGLVVLGIERPDGTFLGVPDGDSEITVGSIVHLYGRAEAQQALDERHRGLRGDLEHRDACAQQARIADDEETADRASRSTTSDD